MLLTYRNGKGRDTTVNIRTLYYGNHLVVRVFSGARYMTITSGCNKKLPGKNYAFLDLEKVPPSLLLALEDAGILRSTDEKLFDDDRMLTVVEFEKSFVNKNLMN